MQCKMDFLQNRQSVFGLDIGYETLKLVQTFVSKKGTELIGAIEIPINERLLMQDRFKNKADTANLIKEAMRKTKPHPITATRIVSALPESFVFSKTIQLPRMSMNEYKKSVPIEASNSLPIPIESVYLDFQVLLSHPNEEMADILVVAAPKKLVDDYLEMAKLAGLELASLETKPLCVGRALIPRNDRAGRLILHIGTEYSRISVWNEGMIRLTSTVNMGQNHLLESMGYSGGDRKKALEITAENESSIAIPMNNVIEELATVIKYHHNRDYKPKPIGEIIICGSAAAIKGIDDYVEEKIKIPVRIAKIELADKTTMDPQFIAAYGLSLWREE